MVQVNDKLTLTITSMTHQGAGVGKTADNFVVFVPFTAVGDTVACSVTKVNKNYAQAELLEILTPSDTRTTSDCEFFTSCGGCCFRHITYREELRLKTEFVENNIKKISKLGTSVAPCLASVKENHYRNNCQTPVTLTAKGEIVSGFYEAKSHNLVPLKDCKIEPPLFEEIRKAVCEFLKRYNVPVFNEKDNRGLVKAIWLRCNQKQTELSLTLIINGSTLPHSNKLISLIRENYPQITCAFLGVHTKKNPGAPVTKFIPFMGKEYLTDTLAGVSLQIAPDAFYQVNHESAQLLYSKVREFLSPTKEDVVLDLYCGIGSIGLSFARDIKELIGVEIVPSAVENAKNNALLNHIHNAQFFCSDSSKITQQFKREKLKPTAVVLDPPRKGCTRETLECVVAMAPKKIVMVSCNPATMARDLFMLTEKGYRVEAVQPVDMFPRTFHVECVVLLNYRK